MTTSAFAPASPTGSFMTTVSAIWEALNVSLEMARIVNQGGYVTEGKLKELRAMAERL